MHLITIPNISPGYDLTPTENQVLQSELGIPTKKATEGF